MDLIDLPASGQNNQGGTRQRVSVAPLRGFRRLSEPVVGDIPETLVLIAETHYLREGFAWKHFDLAINKNQLNAEAQGSVGGGHKFNLAAFMSNLSALQQGTLRTLLAEPYIALVYLANGQVLQLGEKDNGASCDFGLQTGTQEGGETGSPINLFSYHSPRFYAGVIRSTVLTHHPDDIAGHTTFAYYGHWKWDAVSGPQAPGFRTLLAVNDGTSDNETILQLSEGNQINFVHKVGGVVEINWNGPTVSGDVRIALTIHQNGIRISVNGSQEFYQAGLLPTYTAAQVSYASDGSIRFQDQGVVLTAEGQDWQEAITSR